MTWEYPLLAAPTIGESWHEMGHEIGCRFAMLAPGPKSLFDDADWNGAGASGAPTSRAAADDLATGGGRIAYLLALNYIVECGASGATADQVQDGLGERYAMMRKHQTSSARVSEGLRRGRLEPTGLCRKTRSRKWAQVLVDARLRPRWQCTPTCEAWYFGLWRRVDDRDIPCWDPDPVRVHLSHAEMAELVRAAGNLTPNEYVRRRLGFSRSDLQEPEAPPPSTPAREKGVAAFLARVRGA